MRDKYRTPRIDSQKVFETSALACAKNPDDPPPGSWHFGSAYDTFTGHFGPGWNDVTWGTESQSQATGIGFGPGGSTVSYEISGLCANWITFVS